MTEHYFSQKPQTKSSPETWDYLLNGKTFTFTSDIGVFSKNEVDFGSKQLIEQFKEPAITGDLLDLGCGYGPIGIAIADKYKDRHLVMVDINERAIALAEQNASRNQVTNVECMESDRLSAVKNRSFAAILTNPPIRAGKKVVHQMFVEAQQVLKEHGELWVVIQKKQGAPSAKEKLASLFGEVEVVAKNKGYYIFRATNV
ncbi:MULTISPECIES: class I SAM-dependent methyltransferase [Virgibacillus]|uniref:Ribosomal RNA large subunit methyltransferase G n=2 Tax=Virgibacillus TaxID=84406 RepID=A0A024QHK9_9BACI|nr:MULTISPECIES: class I SAM-dependent methyltransferase [Virgibacillus]EQB34586.1 hypothetical protein M948_21315 [Virgibacillus sp. CM-4]MYL43777.1 methyltransferase [Virgibacillus massiliensis]GGJ74795.1 hypothetical protein GCM10007111_40430 [Virgibacillus kapii]CDQ41431.1 Ribosomal RNA large subunit methyltransferase G [Virgibacillus massiliensis]